MTVPNANNADHVRIARAAMMAQDAYPGPVAQVLYTEMSAWLDFGYRFGRLNFMLRLARDIEDKMDERNA